MTIPAPGKRNRLRIAATVALSNLLLLASVWLIFSGLKLQHDPAIVLTRQPINPGLYDPRQQTTTDPLAMLQGDVNQLQQLATPRQRKQLDRDPLDLPAPRGWTIIGRYRTELTDDVEEFALYETAYSAEHLAQTIDHYQKVAQAAGYGELGKIQVNTQDTSQADDVTWVAEHIKVRDRQVSIRIGRQRDRLRATVLLRYANTPASRGSP